MLAASFLHSSFLQSFSAVMLWLVHIEKFLKPVSTTALSSCRPGVMSAVFASLFPVKVEPEESVMLKWRQTVY